MQGHLLTLAFQAVPTPVPTSEGGPTELSINQAAVWVLQLKEYALEYGPAILLNILAAVAMFIVGRMVASWLTALSASTMRRGRVDSTLVNFAKSIIYWALMLFVIMAVLDRLGVDTTSFAAVVAAAGLAVGLALQDSLSNFASGVMLILFHPFRVGNYIEAGGTAGIVEEIQIFNTVMRTGDNKRIIVPNSSITSGIITNYAAHELRRIDLVIMCGYGDNLREVKEFLEEVLAAEPRILDEPAPLVAVDQLADNGVNLIVRPWVKTAEYWDVRWSLTEEIKNGFDDRGFTIPYPTRDINIVKQPA
ncbi:mechanosensitive ion channel family protein [Rubinisphaera italica]|uniref:Small-conductance mechanosensitive channel n=1 Tax=Rubinisphaera italica TaxID=2527969 RepID=A0A5C5XKK5_9PLAN|nr:mechanosensitive ion channel domain-containing protein [Rubinisphaera italica]TWT63756.1 Small-conductance mechanosensitive channel [Rubinisphaera italica]